VSDAGHVAPLACHVGVDTDEILQYIRAWVEFETPTTNADAVNRLVNHVEVEVREIGMQVTRTPGRDDYGDILVARSPWGGAGPGILVLAISTPSIPLARSRNTIRGGATATVSMVPDRST